MPSTILSMKDTGAPARNPGALMQSPRNPGAETNTPQFDSEEEVKLDNSGDVVETTAPPAKKEGEAAPDKQTEEVSTAAPVEKSKEKVDEDDDVGFKLPEEKDTGELEAKPVSGKQQETATTKPETIPSGPRNYDAYPKEIQPVLRALNNAQFKQFAPVLKDLHERAGRVAELEQRLNGKPQFFYEHPEAYKLDPEYNQLVGNINAIQFESSHWQDQLMRIEKGEAWYDLQGYDNQGRPVYKEYPPLEDGTVDYRMKSAVQQRIAQLASLDINTRNQLGAFQAQYQGGRQAAQAELDIIDKKLFPTIPDATKLPAEEKKIYDVAEAIAPRAFKGHPLVDKLGKSYVMYIRLLGMYKKLGQEFDKLRGIGEDAKHTEPAVIPTGEIIKAKRQLKRGEIDPDEDVKLGSDDD